MSKIEKSQFTQDHLRDKKTFKLYQRGGSLDDKIDHLEKFIINEGEYELPEYVLDDIDKME